MLLLSRLQAFLLDAISFTASPRIPDNNTVDDFPQTLPLPSQFFSFYGESFLSAIRFLSKFKGVKSLCIELPSSREIGIDTNCLFKWKAKFGNKIESLLFLAFNSVCDKDGFHSDEINERRGRLFMSGEKLSEVKEWVHSASETIFNRVEVPYRVRAYYAYHLNFLVSDYVMNEVFCVIMENIGAQGGNDGVMNSEIGFEGKDGALYTEALKAILAEYPD